MNATAGKQRVGRLAAVIGGTLLTLAVGPATAGGDAVAGAQVAERCQQCHNPAAPNSAFPKLAGQHEDYLLRTLIDYKLGNRTNPIMKSFSDQLSEQEMADVAAYYAELGGDLFTITYTK